MAEFMNSGRKSSTKSSNSKKKPSSKKKPISSMSNQSLLSLVDMDTSEAISSKLKSKFEPDINEDSSNVVTGSGKRASQSGEETASSKVELQENSARDAELGNKNHIQKSKEENLDNKEKKIILDPEREKDVGKDPEIKNSIVDLKRKIKSKKDKEQKG